MLQHLCCICTSSWSSTRFLYSFFLHFRSVFFFFHYNSREVDWQLNDEDWVSSVFFSEMGTGVMKYLSFSIQMTESKSWLNITMCKTHQRTYIHTHKQDTHTSFPSEASDLDRHPNTQYRWVYCIDKLVMCWNCDTGRNVLSTMATKQSPPPPFSFFFCFVVAVLRTGGYMVTSVQESLLTHLKGFGFPLLK